MFETAEYIDIIVSYLVGTFAGIWLFRKAVLEDIIVKTIDNLVENDFARSYINDDGDLELYKWYDLDDVLEELAKQKEVNDLVQEAVDIQEQMWEDNDEEQNDSA